MTTRTRSGRISKPPERYSPVEDVTDDYAEDEYDELEIESESDDEDDDETEEEEESDDEDDEEDENGNLKGFVVEDPEEA